MPQRPTTLLIAIFLLLAFGGGSALAADIPQTINLDNFWYYDGYLAANAPDAGYIVIPNQPIALYAERDTASQAVGVLPPGQEADVIALCYVAHPGQCLLTVKHPLSTADGNKTLKPGDTVGYVSVYGGDALAVYHDGEVIAVEGIGIEVPRERFKFREAENQWLYLSDRQGVSGWCQYTAQDQGSARRWRINRTTAAGGAANFNPIVFGKFPQFQRLTILLAEQ